MVYILLGSVVLVFLMACNFQFDFRYGAEWTKLTKIPKNSVWRKIYPFKENETQPLLYVKWIPVVVTFIIMIAILIVYIVYWISPPLLSGFLRSKLCGWISVGYFIIGLIYVIIMEIDFKF